MSRTTLTILITGLTLAACHEATQREDQDTAFAGVEVGFKDAADQIAPTLQLEAKTDR